MGGLFKDSAGSWAFWKQFFSPGSHVQLQRLSKIPESVLLARLLFRVSRETEKEAGPGAWSGTAGGRMAA